MRRISAVAVGQPVDDEEIARAAAELSALADRLESAAPAAKRARHEPGPGGFPGQHPQDYFPTSPMVGFANPLAPPVEVWAVEGEDGRRELRGRATFGYQYEGPPTCVHGGVIAEVFDEMLGISNLLTAQGAMTGTLKIRYRRPTPLLAPLELVARNTGRERRKIFAWGGIYYQGELTAEADGIFIHVPPTPHARDREWQRPGVRGAAGRRRLAARDDRGDTVARRSRAGHALVLSVRRARQSR